MVRKSNKGVMKMEVEQEVEIECPCCGKVFNETVTIEIEGECHYA